MNRQFRKLYKVRFSTTKLKIFTSCSSIAISSSKAKCFHVRVVCWFGITCSGDLTLTQFSVCAPAEESAFRLFRLVCSAYLRFVCGYTPRPSRLSLFSILFQSGSNLCTLVKSRLRDLLSTCFGVAFFCADKLCPRYQMGTSKLNELVYVARRYRNDLWWGYPPARMACDRMAWS